MNESAGWPDPESAGWPYAPHNASDKARYRRARDNADKFCGLTLENARRLSSELGIPLNLSGDNFSYSMDHVVGRIGAMVRDGVIRSVVVED